MDEFLEKLRDPWFAFGLFFQVVFMARFIVQWIVSERQGKSVIPIGFWYLSLTGGVGLLIYAIRQQDPVFIFGQSVGSVVYLRNLILIYRERHAAAMAVAATEHPDREPPNA